MVTFVKNLFASDFMPHGHCYLWQTGVVWLHVLSDGLITLAYYSIPITLAYFVRKRRDLPYRWMFLLFGGFIVACGTTHLMEVWTVWHGTYRLAGIIKAITALLSIGTAILLVRLIPEALTLRGPEELARLNVQLMEEVTERRRAEEALRDAHEKLELRVAERSAALAAANAALMIEVDERARAEEQLRKSLREKEVLLKEVHHRVKNNLQVVSSLLNLQSGYIKNPEFLAMLKEDQTRVQSMALVHEKLYRSPSLSQIEFGEYLRSLAASLVRTFGVNPGSIALKAEVDKVFLGVDSAIPCGLIVNELVSNALKYAFPGGRQGEVRLTLHADEQRTVTLAVGDDGVGLPRGLDVQRSETLGLQLVHTLVTQLHGTIEVRTGSGTEFRLRFVESDHKPAVPPA